MEVEPNGLVNDNQMRYHGEVTIRCNIYIYIYRIVLNKMKNPEEPILDGFMCHDHKREKGAMIEGNAWDNIFLSLLHNLKIFSGVLLFHSLGTMQTGHYKTIGILSINHSLKNNEKSGMRRLLV